MELPQDFHITCDKVVIKIPERTLHKTLSDAQIFDAIDLRSSNLETIKHFVTPKAFCDLSLQRHCHSDLSSIASVGCALSHISVWIAVSWMPCFHLSRHLTSPYYGMMLS